MVQLGFRIPTQGDKDFINSALNDVADKFPNEVPNRPSALKKICQIYFDGISSLEFKELPESVTETIHAVQCEYLRWDGEISVFMCYESYHKSHKKHPIDSKHDKVLDACRLCRKGKSDAIRYRVEEGFRKKGINSIFNLTKLLVRMDVEGAVAEIFLCQAKQFTDDEIIISPDCVHLKCPNLEGELVLIEEHCLTQTDPSTMNPPCKWLIAPLLRVPIKPAPEAKAVMEEMKRLAESKDADVQQEPIEVEATIIEVEPSETAIHEALDKMICPKCGSKLEEDAEDSSELYCEKCNYGWRYKRKQSEIIEEGDPIPIEEGESEPIQEVLPQNPRDIFAKENAEKKKKESEEKKEKDEK